MMLYKLLSSNIMINNPQISPIVISLTKGGIYLNQLAELNIPIHSLNMSRSPLSLIRSLIKIYDYMRYYQPNIIQGWMYHGNLAASTAGLMAKQKQFQVYWNIRHCVYELKYEKFMTRQLIKLGGPFSKYANRIIYNSQTSKKQHSALGYHTKQAVVIPNGFDTDKYKNDLNAYVHVREELNLSFNALLVGLIARFHPMKDHLNFLKAAGLVSKKMKNVFFILVGHGIDANNKEICKEVESQNLQNCIFLLGERQDISRITASLDLAVISSFTESFPNVLGEAMSCSVPCVVTDVGDNAWVVGDTGRVVPSKDPQALAKGMHVLLNLSNTDRNVLGQRARRRIIANFRLNAIVRKYYSEYVQMNMETNNNIDSNNV